MKTVQIDRDLFNVLLKDGKLLEVQITVNCTPETFQYVYIGNDGTEFIVEPV